MTSVTAKKPKITKNPVSATGIEQQEKGEGPGDERPESGELAAPAAKPPPGQGAQPVGGPDVDQGEEDDAEDEALDGIAELLKGEDRDRRADQEQGEFRGIDIGWSCEGRDAAETVRQNPGSEQHCEDGNTDAQVPERRPLSQIECVESAEQVADDEEWKGPCPGIEYRTVGLGLDKMGDSPLDEPMLDVSQVDRFVGRARHGPDRSPATRAECPASVCRVRRGAASWSRLGAPC